MLSEKRHAEEEGTAVAWALAHMRFGDAVNWKELTAGRSRAAITRIKRRMWQHIEANRAESR